MEEAFMSALITEVKRRLIQESVSRIKKCLGQLEDAEIWYRPNNNTVSVGNLVLHLCGNVRQWILSGMAGKPDHRNRQGEFDTTGPIPRGKLVEDLDQLMEEVSIYLNTISFDQLVAVYKVQGFEESGIAILLHVVEHFSYHVGQITYFVKTRKDIDLKYYGGLDLNKTGQ